MSWQEELWDRFSYYDYWNDYKRYKVARQLQKDADGRKNLAIVGTIGTCITWTVLMLLILAVGGILGYYFDILLRVMGF